jgi:PEP-CTERM motif
MKRVVLLAVLMLALPIMAFANSSLVFSNHGGSITYTTNLVGNATLDTFTSSGGSVGCSSCNIGHVSYATGVVTNHVLTSTTDSWTFAGGGSFKITSNGTVLLPNGTVFTGTFTGPVTFVGTFNPLGDLGAGAWSYTLNGNVSGNFSSGYGGGAASGGTVQFTFDVHGHIPFSNFVRGNSGNTTFATPEPGTLGLLGTGLIGIAGLVRRKFRSEV